MENSDKKAFSELNFAQIAWVTKDVERAKTFFQEVLGVSNFSETQPRARFRTRALVLGMRQ